MKYCRNWWLNGSNQERNVEMNLQNGNKNGNHCNVFQNWYRNIIIDI